jgi:uncharacterized Zn-binding protein involved in type VI secretion
MPGIARIITDIAGGPILGGGNQHVYCNGMLVAVVGDKVTPHGKVPHATPVMAQGSSTVFINGVPVCRAGDKATCGHAASGSSNTFAG